MSVSRLYRATPTLPRPLFTVATGTHAWADAGIQSILIHHGKQSPAGGLDPATAEIEVAGSVGVIHDRHITVRLNDTAATALAGTTSAGIRFTGRVATQRVRQRARRGKPARATSTLMCSSWSALYLAADGRVPGYNGGMLSELVQNLFTKTQRRVGRSIPLTFSGDWGDIVRLPLEDASLAEVIEKWIAEPGLLLRQRRDGGVQGLASAYRAEAGETAASSWWPITLGHAVSEVVHEQSTDVNDIGIRLTWAQYTGETPAPVYTRDWAWPGSRDGVPSSSVLEWRTFDWSHILFRGEQYRHGINALSHQAFRVAYTTPAITVDLLALIRSSSTYDRTMLRQLLNLQQGDPVVLGGDWSSWWNGIFYAEQITEKITPDAWTIELSLYPPQEVTGWYGAGGTQPPVPVRIWSQAARPWSTGTYPWS